MFNIGIIGVGGLGMRYVQSLAEFKYASKIQIVDISEQALDKTRELFYSMKPPQHLQIECCRTVEDLEKQLDIVAVATGSLPRRGLVEELLSKKKVKYLILEKVLFPCVEDYWAVEQILKEHNCKTWVNCSRRIMNFHKELKKEFEGEHITFSLVGGNWGLGCNGVHLLDLISYITSSAEDINICTDRLDKKIIDSKRSGYIEFTGTLSGSMKNAEFSFTSDKDGNAPFIYTIMSRKKMCVVNEAAGEMLFFEADKKWNCIKKEMPIFKQSEITAPLFEEILETGNCMLPDYQTALKIHIPFLEELLKFMNRQYGTNEKVCPIT